MRTIICILSLIVSIVSIFCISTAPTKIVGAEDDIAIAMPFFKARRAMLIIFLIFELILFVLTIFKCQDWKERIKYMVPPTIYMACQCFIIAIISFM